jgi:hypothetical protein
LAIGPEYAFQWRARGVIQSDPPVEVLHYPVSCIAVRPHNALPVAEHSKSKGRYNSACRKSHGPSGAKIGPAGHSPSRDIHRIAGGVVHFYPFKAGRYHTLGSGRIRKHFVEYYLADCRFEAK